MSLGTMSSTNNIQTQSLAPLSSGFENDGGSGLKVMGLFPVSNPIWITLDEDVVKQNTVASYVCL